MTDYFEVKTRDGPARLGILLRHIQTPTIIQGESLKTGPIVDGGSVYHYGNMEAARSFVENWAPEDRLLIFPHRPLPLAAPENLAEEYHTSWDTSISPSGLLVHPKYRGEVGLHDLYVLGAAREMERNPRSLVESIIWLREHTPPDTALYAPALATPENLPLLVYLGVDVVDDVLATVKAHRGLYLMPDREYPVDRLVELPCACPVCQGVEDPKGMPAEVVAAHNVARLREEIRVIRQRIRGGSMREYVEMRVRSSPWLTAALRIADQQYQYIEDRTPLARMGVMYANTMDSLNRVEVRRYAARVLERYRAPQASALIILPCSAHKPYSASQSHQRFTRAIGNRDANELIITSPLGIVPRELELTYPAAHYDIPVTGYWDREERWWVKHQLQAYLETNQYKRIIAHVDGGPLEMCREVADELGLDIEYTAEQGATARESLNRLAAAVADIPKGNTTKRRLNLMRAIADYQFGRGTGDLLTEGARVVAPYPKHRLESDDLLATLVPQYGLLALSLEGARRLESLEAYWVEMGDFVPRGTLLAPGVMDADELIRPMDEVIVYGEKAFAVGRARMSGWEMRESTRGIAVDIRHIEKL